MLRVALKDLMAHKRRLVTTGIAIILGIAFLTGTQLLSGLLNDSIESLIGDVYEGIDAVVRSPNAQDLGFGSPLRSPVDAAVVDATRQVEGVRVAEGMVEGGAAQLIGGDGKVVGGGFGPPTVTYNWIDDAQLRLGTQNSGRGPLSETEMNLDFKSAQDGGYKLGDEVRVLGPDGERQYTLVGTVGLGKEGNKFSGANVMFFTTPQAQMLSRLPGGFSYVAAAADRGVTQEQLATRLSKALPSEQVLTGAAFTKESQGQISQFVDILTTFVTVFGVIALVVATFIIYNTFSIIVTQRTRETALLRAVGAKRRQVLLATIMEAVVVGLVASALGLAFGYLLALGLKSALGPLLTIQGGIPPLTPGIVVLALSLGLGVTLLSAFVPAWRSTRVPPVAAMGELSIDRSGVSRARLLGGALVFAIGVGLIVLGLAQLGLEPLYEAGAGALLVLISVAVIIGPLLAAPAGRGLSRLMGPNVTSRLAGENAARNPKRTAATAAALTVGVTVVTLIAVLASSIKASVYDQVSKSIDADFVVTTTGFNFGNGIPTTLAGQVAGLPGVDVSTAVRFAPLRLTDAYSRKNADAPKDAAAAGATKIFGAGDKAPPGDDEFALGVDPATIFKVFDLGSLQGDPADLTAGTLAMDAKTAEEHGWKLGSKVPVYFAQTGPQDLTLRLIFERPLFRNKIFLPLATFEPNVQPFLNIDNSIYIKTTADADKKVLRKQLNDLVGDNPTVVVQDVKEYIDTQTAPFDTFLNVVYALLALAIIIALIGIANTLSLSILERTRELGLLRAVGMRRGQLRAMVRKEAAIVAVFGTLMGLVIGMAFAYVLSIVIAADNPGLLTFTPPWLQLVLITLFAALAGIVAAWIPARRASRLDVLAAISSE